MSTEHRSKMWPYHKAQLAVYGTDRCRGVDTNNLSQSTTIFSRLSKRLVSRHGVIGMQHGSYRRSANEAAHQTCNRSRSLTAFLFLRNRWLFLSLASTRLCAVSFWSILFRTIEIGELEVRIRSNLARNKCRVRDWQA